MLLRVSGVASEMCRSQRATGNHTLEALTAFVQVYLRGLIDAPDGSRHFAAQLCFRADLTWLSPTIHRVARIVRAW